MDARPRPSTLLALTIVAVTAFAVAVATGSTAAGAITLAGGLAAALIAARQSAPEPPAPLPPPIRSAGVNAVIDAMVEPILVMASGRVSAANRAACALLGEHILGEDVRVAIRHPAAADRLAAPDAALDTEPVSLVGIGARDQRWQMRVAPLGDGRRLVHLSDETRNYAAQRMRVDFVANASHELRTPLAAILGFVETLADEKAGSDPGVRARFIKVIFTEAQRMHRLVDDLISLSRIEAEKYRAPEEEVDLATLIAEVTGDIKTAGGERARDLEMQLAPGLPAVVGDPAQLSQLLHNLIGNAMKYGRHGSPVRIAAEPAGSMVRLSIADEGEGIPAMHLPRLTERFYRVDPGRSRAIGGTGLGLAIVKHIVERHRGRLDIASTPGVGTTVAVRLPVARVIKA